MGLTAVPGALNSLGISVFDNVLSASVRTDMLADLHDAREKPAIIYRGASRTVEAPTGKSFTVDEDIRRTKRLAVSDDVKSEMHAFFVSLGPELSEHLGFKLYSPAIPSFLRYAPGDFFLPHRDGGGEHGDAEILNRNLSVVLFLNGPDDIPPFAGGELVLLPFEDFGPGSGLVIAASAGRLVVFPPTMVHEVKPVTDGERYTVVTWFHRPGYSEAE